MKKFLSIQILFSLYTIYTIYIYILNPWDLRFVAKARRRKYIRIEEGKDSYRSPQKFRLFKNP